ncbi:hypothetical protein ABVT39_012725 [Epinephelus coioides]
MCDNQLFIYIKYIHHKKQLSAHLCLGRKYGKVILKELKEKTAAGCNIDVGGDARSDAPGYFIDDSTKKIIMSDLIQVTETTSSPVMEKVGFQRGLDRLLQSGVGVGVVTTDRHPSTRKTMRESYPEIKHQFDPWHVAKGVKKKATAAAKKKDSRELQPWIKSVGNHLWWSCSSCGGDEMELRRLWTFILYYVCGIHRWEEDGEEYTCLHEELTNEQQRRKKWLKKGSTAYNALKAIILNKNLLRDLGQMTLFKHTGKAKYNVFHSRLSNQWVARKIYQPMSQDFRKDLVHRVIQQELEKKVKLVDKHFHVHHAVNIPANIAPVPKPNKADVVEKHLSRF